MNAIAAIQMSQLLNSLMQQLSCGEEPLPANTFFSDDAQLTISKESHYTGISAIAEAFSTGAVSYFRTGCLHLLHSVGFRAPDDSGSAQMHANTYSFIASETGVRFCFLRLTVSFDFRCGVWKIRHLHCLPLMTLSPWQTSNAFSDKAFHAPSLKTVSPADYLAIRNLCGRFSQNGPKRIPELLSADENLYLYLPQWMDAPASGQESVRNALVFWEALEEQNGMYVTLFTLQTPVIECADRSHAQLTAFSFVHTIRANAYGICHEPYILERSICRAAFSCINENGHWRIAKAELLPLLTLQPQNYSFTPGQRQLMLEKEKRVFAPDEQVLTLQNAADILEIESIMPCWTEGVKRPDLERFAAQYMNTRCVDPSMHFSFDYIGYPAVASRCREMINKFADQNPELWRYPQFHTANTPVIEIDASGTKATASWFDFGFGNIGVSMFYAPETVQRQYFPGFGKYYHSLIKEDGQWKIYRFFWRPLMQSLPAWDYDTRQVGGWSAESGNRLWPLPFEDEMKE